jgi:hypothetical protein
VAKVAFEKSKALFTSRLDLKLKQEALDRPVWTTCFQRGYGPVVRHYDMNGWMDGWMDG